MIRQGWLVLALVLPLTSCVTRKAMLSRPLDAGIKASYDAPFDHVKKAAYDALADLSFTTKEAMWDGRSENCYVITSSQGLSTGTTGRYARLVLERGDQEQTVYALVESKMATQEGYAVDEAIAQDLQRRIEKRVTSK